MLYEVQLSEELTRLNVDMERALSSRATIEQAKGIVMGQRGCTADEAFAHLVRLSSAQERRRRDVARSIVDEFDGLDEVLAATDADLESVEGVGDMRAKDIREGLRRLQEINLVDRYLQT